ncbi:MAG: hypothetical protein GC162_01755 [Planctomycetes bacterium]|nr:hypothetical protein [Planctomycetota bacterium]
MKTRQALLFVCLMSLPAFAADLPPVPAESIAVKKELLFEDDFSSATPKPQWHKVVPTFEFVDGVLKGTQTRDQNIPAADGKPEVKAHPAVHGLSIPTKDSVVEVRMKFDGATNMDVEFDDRNYTGSHYGHLCRAQVTLTGVRILDERDGTQNEEIKAMREDPSKKAEVAKRMAGKIAVYPMKLDPEKWHTVVVETVGQTMRVTVDGTPAAVLTSSGIGHPTKSKIEVGVSGKSGLFDDIKVWNAEPVK